MVSSKEGQASGRVHPLEGRALKKVDAEVSSVEERGQSVRGEAFR